MGFINIEPPPASWLDDDGKFKRGKYGPKTNYKAQYVEDIAYQDPGYLSWILREVDDIDPEDREIIEAHLDRTT